MVNLKMKEHVNIMKSHENQPETIKNMKTYENTLKNHENQPKTVKNHNMKNIINNGKVQIIASVAMVISVQKISLSHHFEKKTIAITAPQKFGHRSSLYSGLRICVACEAFSKSHAKHLVNRDYETLLFGDFG